MSWTILVWLCHELAVGIELGLAQIQELLISEKNIVPTFLDWYCQHMIFTLSILLQKEGGIIIRIEVNQAFFFIQICKQTLYMNKFKAFSEKLLPHFSLVSK